jgi:glycosyltransferase domain-containing protein
MSNLSDLTLIIVSYNRQRYALRSMAYWSSTDIKVHLIDGSSEAIPISSLDGLENNVTYHHDPRSVYDRMIFGKDLVDTKYASLLSDDEFFLPSGIQACIDELDVDPSLVACIGRTLGFYAKDGRVDGYLQYEIMADYAVLSEDPIERMIYHFGNYTPSTVYAINRAEHWKPAISIMAEIDYSTSVFFQLGHWLNCSLRFRSVFMGNQKLFHS